MKKLFKTLVICGLVALVGSFTTSCTPDQNTDGKGDWRTGPASFEITGEAVVNNAISVDIPVDAKNLLKLFYMVEEYVVKENGEEWAIDGYDANREPKYTHLVSKDPKIAKILQAYRNRKGQMFEKVTALDKLHITGNQGLDRNRKFVVYIAATISDKEYYNNGQIFSVKFETPEQYDSDVTIIRESYEGIDVAITLPQSVKDKIETKNSRATWGITNIAVEGYNTLTNGAPEASCGGLYHNHITYPAFFFKRDTLLEINHYNAYRRNANGEIGWYETLGESCTEVEPDYSGNGSGGPIQYYYEFMPGEPLVLYVSEVDECTKENKLKPTMGFYVDNDGCGWYWFPYDMQAYYAACDAGGSFDPEMFWHEGAWHKRLTLILPKADLFDGGVGVNISDLTTKSGKITFTPDRRTHTYIWGLYAETDQYGGGYKNITDTFLNGDETHWQWFTTSEVAADLSAITPEKAEDGIKELYLESYFKALTPGLKYHLVVNAMGSTMTDNGDIVADPTKQNFKHYEFELKDYKLPEPVLEITPVEAYSPWRVKFNVKNPDWRTNPIENVVYCANLTREFEMYMPMYNSTYTDMAMMNAGIADFYLSQDDINAINSDAGAEIEFDTPEDCAFTAVFLGWNFEGRSSNPDSKSTPGHAEAFSLAITPADPLDITKLNELKGDWTATASVKFYNATTGEHSAPTPMSWKVTIGDLETDKTLSAADYTFLESAGVSKEAADAYLAEYNQQAKAYNEQVKGQNRVLCTGWNMSGEDTFMTATPWDLFLSDTYRMPAVANLFYDFGPKWFLQVNENLDVFVPVHSNRIPVMSKWATGADMFLCGANYDINTFFATHPLPEFENNVEAAGFPVTISEDKNTVTINHYEPIFPDDKGGEVKIPFYPNVVYDQYGSREIYPTHIVSDVVLTRGWTAPAPSTPVVPTTQALNGKPASAASEATFVAPNRIYPKTVFTKQVKPTVITKKQPTAEDFKRGMEKRFHQGVK